MTPCPDATTILAFGRGEGDPATREDVELHVMECDECRSLVSQVLRSSGMIRAVKIPTPNEAMAPTTPVTPGAQTADASPVVAPVKPGDVLAGKYVVERVLGAGGMGVVIAARHLQLDQRFALKFLLPEACKAPDAVARFLREGKAAARITSEHVARVVDTGVLDTGAPYLVLEYLEGADLGDLKEPLSAEDAVEYVLQACEAIVEAHELGIIHRDLKPANLFLARRKDGSPLVKVLDFGISKALEENKQLTSSATMMGSPRYMSPEQMISAKDVDVRADVWALGVILYELVSGKPVWNADTVQGLCAMIATAPTPSLRALVPSAPELLEDVIKRCLAKDPAQRVPSVADFATLLQPLASAPAQTSIDRILRVAGRLRSVPIPKAPPVLNDAPPPRPRVASNASMPALAQTPQTPSRMVSVPPPPANGRAVMGLGIVIALIGIGAGGLLYMNRGDVHAGSPPAAAASFPPAPALPAPAPSASVVEAAPSASASASAAASIPKRVKHIKPAAVASQAEAPAVAAPAPASAPAAAPADPDRAMTDRK